MARGELKADGDHTAAKRFTLRFYFPGRGTFTPYVLCLSRRRKVALYELLGLPLAATATWGWTFRAPAMTTEAEASRAGRAKVIAAEGEYKASTALKEAAMVISQSPAALQLRYLQVIHCATSLRFLPSSKLVSHVTRVGRVLSCNRLPNRKV